MGLIIVGIIREIGRLGILSIGDKVIFIPFPQIFGLNFRGLGTMMNFLSVKNCNQWYMYQFDENINKEDRHYFGHNDGTPWRNVNHSGILNGHDNVLSYPCNSINRMVPYFEEYSQEDYEGTTDMFDYIGK
jgi:hypothetical protein